MNLSNPNEWPIFPADSWKDTRETLHRQMQMVGKTRLSLTPELCQWWNVPFYVTPRGMTTSAMPYSAGLCEIVFDFVSHRLRLFTSDGKEREIALQSEPISEFYRRFLAILEEAEIGAKIWSVPVEVEDTTPFEQDEHHRTYNPQAAHLFWKSCVVAHTFLSEFRSGFTGKCSPVHFFWGSMDMAVTRFSGREAPPHPGAPNLALRVAQEAYCEEVSSAGWWPGGNGFESSFYSYCYPAPPGYAEAKVDAGRFDSVLGEFVLPFEEARSSVDPGRAIFSFLQSSYVAAADLGGWDRARLER